MTLFRRLRVLPLLVLVAGLALAVRIGEFAVGLNHAGQAYAQQEVNKEPPPLHDAAEIPHSEEEHSEENAESHAEPEGLPALPLAGEGEKVDWKDATEAAFEYSEVRAGLYKDLAARREELEQREKALVAREALLEAGQRELDQKLREMTAVRNEIKGLLTQQSEEEQARIKSLVTIYEGMKAKDAANIFNTLDIDVLIAIMGRMSERKSAPILAEMTPERARSVTILLAQEKQIPDIPPQ